VWTKNIKTVTQFDENAKDGQMMEIYLSDLSKEKQKEIVSELGGNGNYDIFPIATIETENKEEE